MSKKIYDNGWVKGEQVGYSAGYSAGYLAGLDAAIKIIKKEYAQNWQRGLLLQRLHNLKKQKGTK